GAASLRVSTVLSRTVFRRVSTTLAHVAGGGMYRRARRDAMRCVMKTLVVCAAVALVCAPLPARADGYFSPWAGVNFGNTQAEGHRTFGVSAGAMGAGVFGGEF